MLGTARFRKGCAGMTLQTAFGGALLPRTGGRHRPGRVSASGASGHSSPITDADMPSAQPFSRDPQSLIWVKILTYNVTDDELVDSLATVTARSIKG